MLVLLLGLTVAAPVPAPPPHHADSGGGQWSTARKLPEPLLEARAAVLAGRIYVAGGIDGSGQPSSRVYRYDPASDTWERVADLPAARHHMPLAAVGDSVLYALGGFSGRDFRPERTVWAYYPARNAWQPKALLPRPRAADAAVTVKNEIVVVGGLWRIADGGMSDLTAIYNAPLDSWHDGWPILTKRDHLTAAVVQSTVYAIGGRLLNPDHNLATVEAYDPEHDRWATKPEMLEASGALASAVLDGKIHVFGGESRFNVFAEHEVYDPVKNEWAKAPPLPTARHGIAAAAVAGRIYVIGGGTRPGFSESDVVEVFTP